MLVADGDLGAAAADVEEERALAAEVDAAGDAQVDQARLLLAGDDAHVEPRLLLEELEEAPLVFGLAAGGGGDGDDLGGAVRARHVGEPRADEHGAVHGLLLEALLRELALAEPHRLALARQDRVRAVRVEPHQQQPHRVRADVHEADDAAVGGRRLRRHGRRFLCALE